MFQQGNQNIKRRAKLDFSVMRPMLTRSAKAETVVEVFLHIPSRMPMSQNSIPPQPAPHVANRITER